MTANTFDRDLGAFKRRFLFATAGYVAMVVGASLGLRQLESVPAWAGPAAALAAIVPAVYMLASGPLWLRRHEDSVEQALLVRSTSFAFFVTMAAALSTGLFEVLAATPPLSGWALYSVGMVSWLVAHYVLARRFA